MSFHKDTTSRLTFNDVCQSRNQKPTDRDRARLSLENGPTVETLFLRNDPFSSQDRKRMLIESRFAEEKKLEIIESEEDRRLGEIIRRARSSLVFDRLKSISSDEFFQLQKYFFELNHIKKCIQIVIDEENLTDYPLEEFLRHYVLEFVDVLKEGFYQGISAHTRSENRMTQEFLNNRRLYGPKAEMISEKPFPIQDRINAVFLSFLKKLLINTKQSLEINASSLWQEDPSEKPFLTAVQDQRFHQAKKPTPRVYMGDVSRVHSGLISIDNFQEARDLEANAKFSTREDYLLSIQKGWLKDGLQKFAN